MVICWRFIITGEDEVRARAPQIIGRMKEEKDWAGKTAYPGLNNKQNHASIMLQVETNQAMAVKITGEYTTIPDLGENGVQNFDYYCRACVNIKPRIRTCDLWDRDLRWLYS